MATKIEKKIKVTEKMSVFSSLYGCKSNVNNLFLLFILNISHDGLKTKLFFIVVDPFKTISKNN